ncbi:MAG: polyprenyl synthetase family protein [Cellulosilyticaceae bacterium]
MKRDHMRVQEIKWGVRVVESMDEELVRNREASYHKAEQKGAYYFEALYKEVINGSYVQTLTDELESWGRQHTRSGMSAFFLKYWRHQPDASEYHEYIKWMDRTGQLESYLERSIAYIFMRDLGKDLGDADTRKRIRHVVDDLIVTLRDGTVQKGKTEKTYFDRRKLYRKAQEEGIESTLIWLMEKLGRVSENIPEEMDKEHAERKLIKIIIGVVLHEMEEMEESISPSVRKEKLERAIRLGYAYGLTYPFIDDLLDAKILSEEEEERYTTLIRESIVTGKVPALGLWNGPNKVLMTYIHDELKGAFEYIQSNQKPDTIQTFFEQSYVFFNAQEVDRHKSLDNPLYTNEAIYIPVILKAASSRLIVRSVIGATKDSGFDSRTFYYGIYNQLADDFADMFDDWEAGVQTPYTYYRKYHKERKDLINPFALYWAVISNLIHNVYHSDRKTCDIILSRAINGLKRFKERMGSVKYKEIMDLLATGDRAFDQRIQHLVEKAEQVAFFDKLARDQMLKNLKEQRREQAHFVDQVETVRQQINKVLKITEVGDMGTSESSIIQAANYSVEGAGKRLRPILTWVMGVDVYGLSEEAVIPLLRSMEYMHTASLIFDDLPSQDNAPTRRGRPTLHQVYNTATAELTGLFLTQKAIEEQTHLKGFDPRSVLKLIRYCTQVTEQMCKGQIMDLEAKDKALTIQQLNQMCFYKTGIAFEVALLLPALLAEAQESEIEELKQFAYHAGIAFQIKDDLLDVEGDTMQMGKETGKDVVNNRTTFVTVLGREDAKKQMWEHYSLAGEALERIGLPTKFMHYLLDYIINRNH